MNKNFTLTKFILIAIIAVLSFQSCSNDDDSNTPPLGDDEIVVISDATLREIVLTTLGLNSPAALTKQKIKELTELNLSGTDVVTLEGLEIKVS